MFHRHLERAELRFHADRGRSMLMLAPRRIGKTWLIKRFAEDLRAAGWLAILCDVQDISTEVDFLRHLCLQIEDQGDLLHRAEGRAKQIFNQVFASDHSQGWRKSLGQTDWKSFAKTLVEGLDASGRLTMIIIDELALFVAALMRKSVPAAREFLYGLRSLQQAHPNVLWFFTGSIGLDTIARRGDIAGALVNLHLFTLEPFSPEAARAFVEHLCTTGQVIRPFSLDDDGFTTFAESLGWLAPFYIEKIAHLIRPTGSPDVAGRPTATSTDVASAFEAILAREYRNYFVPWEEHLRKNFKPTEAASMRRILGICSKQASGEQLESVLARLGGSLTGSKRKAVKDQLDVLVSDGYLSELQQNEAIRFFFRSGLLRRYWQRYYLADEAV